MLLRYAMAVLGTLTLTAPTASAADSGKLAFVVRDWFTAVYESRFMDECPEGLNLANDDYWWHSLSKADRAKYTDNGLIQTLNRFGRAIKRGPNGENVCLAPELITDPPLRTVEGKYSYGSNLDGTTDGHATAKSCAHQKFTGVDGVPAVDNQLYRLLGCTYGWRKQGIVDLNGNEMRGTSGLGMILIEITGVKDPRNSDDVTITFYRSIDQFSLDSKGDPLPFTTYRIEMWNGKPRYGDSIKGRIKNGVLETERGEVRLPFYGNYGFMHPTVKDMGLHLEIAADGRSAEGLLTGYYDMEQFLYWFNGAGAVHPITYVSCPALNVAAHQLADGYPDPKTGECTRLSSAFHINAYAAFALHPDEDQKQAAR